MNSKLLSYGKNLSIYFGASLIPMALNLITNPLIAMNMSPEDYAIVGYYTSYSSLIGPIIVFYLVHYYIKEYFRRDENSRLQLKAMIAKALIFFSSAISVVCFGILFIYLAAIRKDFNLPILPYLALMVFALPLTGLLALEQAQFRMDRQATAYFKLTVANGALAVVLSLVFVVLLKWGALGKLLGILVCNLIIFFILVAKYWDLLKFKIPIKQFFPVLSFCLPLALSATLGYFNQGFSTTYLESLNMTTQYGIYVVGMTIGLYLTTFSTAINNTFQPDLYESIAKRWWKRYIKVCALQISLISAIAIIFIIAAPYIIGVLTANRYVQSTPYAQIVSLASVSSSIYYIINNFSIATDRPKLYLYTTIIGSAIIILAMPLVVNKFQFIGGAWMIVISYIIFAIINCILLLIPINKKPWLKKSNAL